MSHINTSSSSLCRRACGLHPPQTSTSHLFFLLWWKGFLSYLHCAATFPQPPNNSPTSFLHPSLIQILPPTYLSFLFGPFCFPAKLLNSSSVGCWYHRRLWTKKRRKMWYLAQTRIEEERVRKRERHNRTDFKVVDKGKNWFAVLISYY